MICFLSKAFAAPFAAGIMEKVELWIVQTTQSVVSRVRFRTLAAEVATLRKVPVGEGYTAKERNADPQAEVLPVAVGTSMSYLPLGSLVRLAALKSDVQKGKIGTITGLLGDRVAILIVGRTAPVSVKLANPRPGSPPPTSGEDCDESCDET